MRAGGLADRFGGGEHPAAGDGEQRGPVRGDERSEFLVELLDRVGELADAFELVACDADLGAGS